MLGNIDLSSLNIPLSYPFAFLTAVAIVLLLCSGFWKSHQTFYMATSSLSLIVNVFLILNNIAAQGLEAEGFLGTLNNNIVSLYASLVILCFSFLHLLMQKEENQGGFYSLFLFMVAGLLLMVLSSSLILIFIGLESSSLTLCILIAMRGSNNAISSAIKYSSVTAVGPGFFVMASALIYIRTGTLDLGSKLALDKDPIFLGVGVMIFILCAIKLSLAPFHFWLKDVYSSAYADLVAFISVVPKIAMFVVVIRLFSFLNHLGFENILNVLTIFSMLVAALATLSQKDVKKMFAYSSIVHSSFVLAACIPLLSAANDVLNSIFVHWVLFGFANYGVFLVLSTFKGSLFEEFDTLLFKKPLIALLLSSCIFSLAGIPPFGAFWGKVMMLKTLVIADYWYLALFMTLASFIMLYAYLKLVIHALLIKTQARVSEHLNFIQSFILALCTLVSVFASFLPLEI